MKRFAALWAALDQAAAPEEKVAAVAGYLRQAPPADAAWALSFLIGRRIKRLLPARLLAGWAGEAAAVPEWLVEESYAVVGDLAETAALLLAGGPPAAAPDLPLATWVEERLLLLRALPPAGQRARVLAWWRELRPTELLVLNKLLTGTLRPGVSGTAVEQALAAVTGLPAALLGRRLAEAWQPDAAAFAALTAPAGQERAEEPPAEPAARPAPRVHRIDAVLLYAQPGPGGRAGPLNDYTVGVWSEGRLVTLARAASGLPEDEALALDRWIRRHTDERFGPVRAVEPVQVLEVAFEGIARSSRHRSGVALCSPRAIRWRTGTTAAEAATLEAVQALLDGAADAAEG